MNFIYELEFKVRDYECDLQGIVNNANYQHYLEHTRHEFLLTHNISFSQLHDEGIDVVVARVDIAYKNSLRSGDRFVSKLALAHEGIKYTFYQNIYRLPDMQLCVRAKTDCVAAQNGKLSPCEKLDTFIDNLLK
ncbi:MAG: acyl-CoA thioesterase [Paludibacteraceae bacterium]|mgnify:CR=1 FL=1|nr:acyl-CoA thioesterase [Paludibacteraceae bacterium]